MEETNNKELLTGAASGYRSLVRAIDMILELQKDVADLKKQLSELENRKCGGCGHA